VISRYTFPEVSCQLSTVDLLKQGPVQPHCIGRPVGVVISYLDHLFSPVFKKLTRPVTWARRPDHQWNHLAQAAGVTGGEHNQQKTSLAPPAGVLCRLGILVIAPQSGAQGLGNPSMGRDELMGQLGPDGLHIERGTL
jgi:hypothetical protein